MLYSYDNNNNKSVSLKLMIQKIINEGNVDKNAIFVEKITTIVHDAKTLRKSESAIFTINSSFFQEIIFLSRYATDDQLQIPDRLDTDKLNELLTILNKLK